MTREFHSKNFQYINGVYMRLMNLPIGGEIEFSPEKGTKEDWEKFIMVVKLFIDEITGHPQFDYQIQISNDYTRLRKIKTANHPISQHQSRK